MEGTLCQLSRAFSSGTQANPEKHFPLWVILNTQKSVGNFKQKVKTAQSHTREETDLSRDVEKLSIKEGPLWAGENSLVGKSDSNKDLAYAHQALPWLVLCSKRCLGSFLKDTHTQIDLFCSESSPQSPEACMTCF